MFVHVTQTPHINTLWNHVQWKIVNLHINRPSTLVRSFGYCFTKPNAQNKGLNKIETLIE